MLLTLVVLLLMTLLSMVSRCFRCQRCGVASVWLLSGLSVSSGGSGSKLFACGVGKRVFWEVFTHGG